MHANPASRELHKRCRSHLESLLRLWAVQDLDGLIHTLELLRVHACECCPLNRLFLTRLFHFCEKLHIGLQLNLERVQLGLSVCLSHGQRRRVSRRLQDRILQHLKLLILRGHKLLEGLLLLSLFPSRPLEPLCELVVHLLKNALDLPRFGRVVSKGVVVELQSRKHPTLWVKELFGVIHKMANNVEVTFRHYRFPSTINKHRLLENTLETPSDAQQLRLLQSSKKAHLPGVSARQRVDRCLKRSHALLSFALVCLVL